MKRTDQEGRGGAQIVSTDINTVEENLPLEYYVYVKKFSECRYFGIYKEKRQTFGVPATHGGSEPEFLNV